MGRIKMKCALLPQSCPARKKRLILAVAAFISLALSACGTVTPSAPAAVATVTVVPTPTVTKTVAPASIPQIVINNNNPAPAAPAPAQTVVVVPAAPAVVLDDCPVGYVCMYTVAGWRNQQPEHEYFDYGYYNLSSEIGPRVIVNNQTDAATVTGYYHYGGTGPAWTLQGQREDEYNVTPINSIGLNP
jgi:hypothetical protein